MAGRGKKNRSQEKNALGSFRLIGGSFRSRRLNFPDLPGLRPTTDRVKETVFNWLSWRVEGARVLDLFAGSGSLGFEAASRGASFVQFVDASKQAVRYLEQNTELLQATAKVQCADALNWIRQYNGEPFEVLFLDPPFRQGILSEVIQLLAESSLLSPNALIYVESEKELGLSKVPAFWRELKHKEAGQVAYYLYEFTGASE